MHCDGYECFTSFPQDKFQSAETYFNDHLLSAMENAKLDRPIDSTPPLARSIYIAQEADWGGQWGYDQAYHTDTWYEETWHKGNEEHPPAMEYEEHLEEDTRDDEADPNEEVCMSQEGAEDGANQEHHLFEEGDTSDEEDDEGYESDRVAPVRQALRI
jgi:hypothetical protein